MPASEHDTPGLELGARLSGQRSRTSEAELQQEAVRWDSRAGRYAPEPSPDTVTATSTLVGDGADQHVGTGLNSHTFAPLEEGKAGAEGEKPAGAHDRAGAAEGALASAGGPAEPGGAEAEPIWVDWEEGDTDNPYNWSNRRRWVTTVIVCFNTFLCSWCGASFGSGNPSMEVSRSQWGSTEIARVGGPAWVHRG